VNNPELDPEGLWAALHEAKIDYVLIGAFAAVLHGSPMPTMDIDICPRDDEENVSRLAGMLLTKARALWSRSGTPFAKTHAEATTRLKASPITSFTTRWGRLDVIFEPAGTTGFTDLIRDAQTFQFGGLSLRVASLRDVIRSKQASGRETDLAQLPALRKLLERGGPGAT
jgi:hypothetical protein